MRGTGEHIHFTPEELAGRRSATCAKMAENNLDALLIFRQESMYYLTGYDTFGYVYFQCLVLTPDGVTTLLTRAPDKRQAEFTSTVDDIQIWKDGVDADPFTHLKSILADKKLEGKTIGVEWESYGLNASDGRKLAVSLRGWCTLDDASKLVSEQRLVKSAAEIAYVRRAAELADDALDAAIAIAKPGAFEGDILADMHSAIFKGGGDDPGNEFIIGSGPGALMCRYFTGRRNLSDTDQLTLEWAGTYRHYHAAMMRTLTIGPAPERQRYLYESAHEALLACEDALKPGNPISDVFDAHANVLDKRGLAEHRLNACGYSQGTTYGPNWMDWPMLYAGNPVIAKPGMTFFMHMIIFDSDAGVASTLGHTALVTDTGCERLSRSSLELVEVT